jgi:hypothetical protein
MISHTTIRHRFDAMRARRNERILRRTTFCESCGTVTTPAGRFEETRECLQQETQERGFIRF